MTGLTMGAGPLAAASGASAIPDGTVLFTTPPNFVGPWTYTFPAGVSFFTVEGLGGGGVGTITPSKAGSTPGPGGGAAGYFKSHSAVSVGVVIGGVVGQGATNTGAPVPASATTLNANAGISLAAATANPGSNGVLGGAAGAGGTASGGSATNTTGHAGGLTNAWDGGGAPPALVDQTIAGANPTGPGAGAPGGINPNGGLTPGANGQITIIAKSS